MTTSHDVELHLDNLHDSVVRHFVSEDGRCLSCDIDVKEHRVVFPNEMNEEWVICWTETGRGAHGGYIKHFCVRAEDHPGRMSREEFEDLYSE